MKQETNLLSIKKSAFHTKCHFFFPLLPSTVHNINVQERSILEFKTLKHSVQSEIDEKPTVSD